MATHYYESEVESLFDRKFDFYNESNCWKLPSTALQTKNSFTELSRPNLEKLKNELNELKQSLNDYDITKWNKHTRNTNPAGYINEALRCNFHPELCTQAWAKFHELSSFGDIVPDIAISTCKLNAIHVCEAPGAFISSLNHFLRSHIPKVKYKWIACTLNPYYEGNDPESCIGDDRLIFETLNFWCFGRDNTGDILSKAVFDDLHKKASELDGIIHLVTADGSINCQENPENQERDTMSLKYAEIFYALNLLDPGGSFVLKSFTMFEAASTVLLFILCCTFSSVSVRKPATSKPGNSEVYVIARGYHGKEQCAGILSVLERRFPFKSEKDFDDIIPLSTLPPSFLAQHEECIKKFVDMQMKTIRHNKESFGKKYQLGEYDEYKRRVSDTALELMKMKKIQKNQCLLKSGILRGRMTSNIKLRPKLVGSYSQRHCHDDGFMLEHPDKLKDWREENNNEVCWNTCANTLIPDVLDFVCGKPYSSIKLSLFCDTDLLIELHKKCNKISNYKPTDDVLPADDRVLDLICQIASSTMHDSTYECIYCDLPQSTWTKLLARAHVSSLRHVKKINPSTFGSLTNCSLLLASLVDEEYGSSVFRELKIRNSLLDITILVLKFLEYGSSFAMIIPSVLTRFSAGLIWMLCQSFDEYSMTTDRSPAVLQIYLICKGKKDSKRSMALLNTVEMEMKETNSDEIILQILPPQFLLQDKIFSSELRRCNHQMINRRLHENCNFLL